MRVVLLSWAFLLAAPPSDFDHRHAVWNSLISRHVYLDGAVSRVDYSALRKEATLLNTYLEALSAVSTDEFEDWSPQQQMAFLINAYNAFTVKLIVDNYPVDSIKDLGGWFSSPWELSFFNLLGQQRNLDDIEHGILRVDFPEPRVHFAVNCASLGCPPLLNEAFVPARLDEQLEANTRRFLTDSRRNRVNSVSATLELSPIFKWYGRDFGSHSRSVERFVASRITQDPDLQARIRNGELRVRFLDYDWALNDRN